MNIHMYRFLQCFYRIYNVLKFSMQHLSTQEPNLSHEWSTQSTVAFLSFPGFYFPFKAGEGI